VVSCQGMVGMVGMAAWKTTCFKHDCMNSCLKHHILALQVRDTYRISHIFSNALLILGDLKTIFSVMHFSTFLNMLIMHFK
jgi:hypothetical protein